MIKHIKAACGRVFTVVATTFLATSVQAQECGRLNVPDSAAVVVVGGYEGQAISSHRIGRARNETHVIDIRVELGREPLFLMLDSLHSVIWRVSGNIARVAGVGIDGTIAGIIGIEPEKVQYFDGVVCDLDIWKGVLPDNARETGAMLQILKQSPKTVLSGYELGLVSVPSGNIPRVYRYPGERPSLGTFEARQVERDLRRFHPGGIVDIEPERVVSNTVVAPYDLLPMEAGLAQLVEAGAIEITGLRQFTRADTWGEENQVIAVRTSKGRVIRLRGGDDFINDDGQSIRVVGGAPERSFIGERQYILREEISVPIGLSGAHSVIFWLPEGVLPPRGDLGGSELFALEEE